jgi:glycosyltransferase involved in cell wall biosynthesis
MMNRQERSPRICLLTACYPDYAEGKLGKFSHYAYRGHFIKKLVKQYTNRHRDVFVVTPKIYQDSPHRENYPHEHIYRFPFWSENKLLNEYKKIPLLRMITYMLSGLYSCMSIIRENHCHLIHAHFVLPTGVIGVIAGILLKKPVIVTAHGTDINILPEKYYLMRLLVKWVLKKSNRIVCVAEHIADRVMELGITRKKIVILPMGIDDHWIRQKSSKTKTEIPVISTRNLGAIYNIPLLLRCIPHLAKRKPDVCVTIAGEGPQKYDIMKMADDLRLGKHVRFIGRIDNEDMPDYLNQAKVYVSTSFTDGSSVSLLEAMASGAFPVVSDISANREWITDGMNGFLVPLNDEKYLAEKILEALDNPGLRERAKKVNHKTVKERALWSDNIDKMIQIDEDVMRAFYP